MISWIGTLSSILGSFLVAFGVASVGYVAFLVGSFSWLVVAYKRRDRALALLNLTFFAANIIGIVRYTI
jgi:nicotinamide riboside transporter PnuC